MGHYAESVVGRVRTSNSAGVVAFISVKKCQRMPWEKRDRIERFEELHGFLHQSMISVKNVARLDTLTGHEDHQVAELAA